MLRVEEINGPIDEQAALALRLANEDPQRAEVLATQVRDLAVAAGLAGVESVALRALGLAARKRHQIPEALEYLGAAVGAGERAGDFKLAAEARLSLAGALIFAGENDAAMAALDGAQAKGLTAVGVASQRAAILSMLGRHEEALRAYRPVIAGFRRFGDRVREGRALNHRGLLHVYAGRFSHAEADLTRSQSLLVQSGNLTEAAGACHNRGFAAARKGDLPAALALFEEADRRYREVGMPPAERGLDRAAALNAAGLVLEARVVAEGSLDELNDGGNQHDRAEGLVLLADIALLATDPQASRAAAEEAARLFEAQGRTGWQWVAQAAVARAGLANGDSGASLAGLASGAAVHLEEVGLLDQATMAHAVAGRLWLANGQLDRAVAELGRAGARRHRGTAVGRLAAWEAEAMARVSRGDRPGAMVAASRALGVVSDQQASLGATELRAHVAVHAGSAARLGLGLALETGRARSIWQWMERNRANSLQPSPVRPSRDSTLAAQLAELRALATDMAACVTRGDDPSAYLRRQSDLERQVRERAWQAVGTNQGRAGVRARAGGGAAVALAELSQALGRSVLVELAESGDWLEAVVIVKGRCYHRRLAAMSQVRNELSHLRLTLRRLAYGGAHGGPSAELQMARAAGELDELVMGPLASLTGSSPVVLVPTGELHATPWLALPSLAGRPVSVAPSARMWLATTTGPGRRQQSRAAHVDQGPVVVAGPGLPGAEREAAAVAALYPSPRVLTGAQATVASVAKALEGAELVHIAAHARFRSDKGLWSSLALADGELTVYELEQQRRPPKVVVLSACQSGLSAVRSGDEVMGLAAALLTLGAKAVVASVVPVQDQASEALMVALHRRLLGGDPPALALARAQATVTGPVAVSYVCFGGM